MSKPYAISLVLHAHLPYILRPDDRSSPKLGIEPVTGYGAQWFFESLSETYLPLLQTLERLDGEHIPFKLGLSLSPILSHMLRDEALLGRFVEYMDKRIAFGIRELERTQDDPDLHALVRTYYDQAVEQRFLFTERYDRNILRVLDFYQRKGRIELITTSATHAFLPLYASHPEAIQAQIEVAIASYRANFGRNPQGFWLPELGWSRELDEYLRSYNFSYTLVETHGALLGKPEIRRGSFYPIKTPSQVLVLIRDFYAARDVLGPEGYSRAPAYRDNQDDPGYDFPLEFIKPFIGGWGGRIPTGYRYRSQRKVEYDPALALRQARDHARMFLNSRIAQFRQAETFTQEPLISLCSYEADSFGRFWHEGIDFLEALFREGSLREEIQFMNPGEYLFRQDTAAMDTSMPEFSSWSLSGYGDMWLDSSNDWLYRHGIRSLERMVELAERFPNDSGLKERALNQAAREILLVQTSDWPKMLFKQESAEYARKRIEHSLRNFTTIYEALGSNYISTEWLTNLERRHNIFPNINYRVFRRKR